MFEQIVNKAKVLAQEPRVIATTLIVGGVLIGTVIALKAAEQVGDKMFEAAEKAIEGDLPI